jgi:hypothetical protein
VRSSATATVGHAPKFVRSRNPVAVIVKIVDGADYGVAGDTEWRERRGELARSDQLADEGTPDKEPEDSLREMGRFNFPEFTGPFEH